MRTHSFLGARIVARPNKTALVDTLKNAAPCALADRARVLEYCGDATEPFAERSDQRMNKIKNALLGSLAAAAVATAVCAPAAAQQQQKPNIVIIWGDDIGQFNISAFNHGMMGYRTPNIDSIAQQGALFTDWYGQ